MKVTQNCRIDQSSFRFAAPTEADSRGSVRVTFLDVFSTSTHVHHKRNIRRCGQHTVERVCHLIMSHNYYDATILILSGLCEYHEVKMNFCSIGRYYVLNTSIHVYNILCNNSH